MRKFIGIGIGIGILLLFLVLGFALAYNYLFPAPHEHHSTSEVPTVETLPTCTSDGVQYKLCAGCGEKYDAEILSALGHSFANAVEEDYIEPTCTTDGSYDKVSYCTECDYFVTEHVTISALGHTNGSVKTENPVSPTCTENGYYYEVTYCTVCNGETSREKITVPANGHSDMVWELSRDENDDFVMTGEGSCGHTFEIYPADEDVTSAVTLAPTCCHGEMTYTATVLVDGVEYSAQTKEEIAPIFSHKINGVDYLEYSLGVNEFGKHYFEVSQELGIYKDENDNWGIDGFADGFFKCSCCGEWISITVFDPDKVVDVETQ